MIKNILQETLKVDMSKLLEHLLVKNEKLSDTHVRSLIFGDYFKSDGPKIYDEITNLDELIKVMER
jgi:hypothetical protein